MKTLIAAILIMATYTSLSSASCTSKCPDYGGLTTKSQKQSAWICEMIEYICHTKEWMASFMNWWSTSCAETAGRNISMMNTSCPDMSAFECCSGNQTCEMADNGCEFCWCMNGSFRDISGLTAYWKQEMMKYKEMKEEYRNAKDMCTQSSCDTQTTPNPLEGSGMTTTEAP